MVTGGAMPGMPHGGMRTMDIIFQVGTVTRTGCRISVPLDTGLGIPAVNGTLPQASVVMDTIRARLKANGMPPQALGAMSADQSLSRANGINPRFQKQANTMTNMAMSAVANMGVAVSGCADRPPQKWSDLKYVI